MDLTNIAYTNTKIKEAINALSAANIPTSDGSNVQTKLTSYAEILNVHTSDLSGINTQLENVKYMASSAYPGTDLTVRFAAEIAAYGGDPWAWIKARIDAEDFSGLYLRDYIPVTCANGYIIKPEIVGINTYKGSGNTEIPAHIDFISRDCWPDTVVWNLVNYNNGTGMDKFVGNGTTTTFQLTRRENGGFPVVSSVTVNGTTTTDYTYNATTGVLTMTAAPANAAVIRAIWDTPVAVPILASHIHAHLNSLRMGVPNESAADPLLTEVDYRTGGIYYYLPAALKAVITPKRIFAATRYGAGVLKTASDGAVWIDIGPLWLLDEMEVYGAPMYATATDDRRHTRMYPAFYDGNRRKGAGNGGSRSDWWLLPATFGGSTSACYVSATGVANSNSTSYTSPRPPVSFRIRKS